MPAPGFGSLRFVVRLSFVTSGARSQTSGTFAGRHAAPSFPLSGGVRNVPFLPLLFRELELGYAFPTCAYWTLSYKS